MTSTNKRSKHLTHTHKKTHKHKTHKKTHKHKSHTHKSHTHKSHTHKSKKFIEAKCSPLINNDAKKPYSCYTDKQLIKLRDLWNERHPDVKIKESDSKEIWKKLRENMRDVCNRESCWLKQKFVKNNISRDLLQYTFAPKSPEVWKKNPNEWLTSIDISNVMKQYEKAYSCFEFIGPSPIDFDTHMSAAVNKDEKPECVWQELCEFKLIDYLKKGKKKIGIIFNLDPHYLSGSHWVALFINIKEKFIFYFDSNGDPVPKQIKKLITKIKKQGMEHNIKFSFDSNQGIEHQLENTECGIYCLYFIIQLLKDKKSPDYFTTNIIRDDVMIKLRNVYFNEY